ncbi:MAG: DNA adenine methylase, partial [Limisphaerales bacterium]
MKYDGGKNATFRHIVNEMPPHRNFIELFLGSGAVMRNKLPAPVLNVGVEIKPQVAARAKSAMPTVDVVEGDAIKWLAHYDHRLSADTLVYADPPYLMITRSHKRPLYEYEFSEEHDHKRLLRFLLDTRAMVMVSGYRSDLY